MKNRENRSKKTHNQSLVRMQKAAPHNLTVINMTHKELIKRADRWLLNTKGCGFTLLELVAYTDSGEIPDAIGWRHNVSYMVECKSSRSDFLSDSKKPFRRRPWMGVGDFRYYMAPPGIIKPNELPKKWGLLEVHSKTIRVVVEAEKFSFWAIGFSAWRERPLLISALRRVKLRGDLGKIYNQQIHATGNNPGA